MTQEVKMRRVQCNYQAENARFLLECDFSKQYSHYYRKRLEKTRPFLEFNCRSKWDPSIPLYGLAELATLAFNGNLQLSQANFPSSPSLGSISPESGPSSYYKFPKRMRKFSSSSKDTSPHPKTSTQLIDKPAKFDKDNRFDSPKPTPLPLIESPVESPILPTTKQQKGATQEVSGDQNHFSSNDCIVIGTIFKRMKLQPDVVKELSQGDFHVNCERYLGHYTSQDDKLVLEDEDESISLVGNINPKRFVTGITVALLGVSIDDASYFLVRDICYAEPNSQILYEDLIPPSSNQPERPLQLAHAEPIYLMIVSGLGFHQDMGENSVLIKALQHMIDFVWGADKYSEDERSSHVSRILVAGDSLFESRLVDSSGDCLDSLSQERDLALKMKQSRQVKPFKGSIQAIKHMDDFFAQLSKTIDVHVMPGPSDPSSHLMPQQPFHPCMFPKSCMFSTFNCTTNPHHAIYNDDVEILTTSGQNIDIISKFSGIKDPIEIMKCHLMWGNSAPSAPDNLYSVPYEDDDPHVIEFIPEIYIAGNQESYRTDYYYYSSGESSTFDSTTTTKLSSQQQKSSSIIGSPNCRSPMPPLSDRKKRTLLVTVPKFNETYSCVLINLRNLESHLLSFR